MAKLVKLTSKDGNRNRTLGAIGEDLAALVLLTNGFSNVTNINRLEANFPFADFYAERSGIKYVISVKTRNKYEYNKGLETRKLNSFYKLQKNYAELAQQAEHKFGALAAWMAIALEERTFSAYFGLLSDVRGCVAFGWDKLTCHAMSVSRWTDDIIWIIRRSKTFMDMLHMFLMTPSN